MSETVYIFTADGRRHTYAGSHDVEGLAALLSGPDQFMPFVNVDASEGVAKVQASQIVLITNDREPGKKPRTGKADFA